MTKLASSASGAQAYWVKSWP